MTERMFTIDGQRMTTWNVLHGCTFDCSYCSVRKMVLNGRLKGSEKYKDGMAPGISEKELDRKFKPGEWVFVGYMGDVACQPSANVMRILDVIRTMPEVNFYMQSKNPDVFFSLIAFWGTLSIPDNIIFGTTLETNRATPQSKAPCTLERAFDLRALQQFNRRLMVSIEPIMDFDSVIFLDWLVSLNPERIFIGADNYHNHLPEPSGEKVKNLIENLKRAKIEVIEKPGLERLMK